MVTDKLEGIKVEGQNISKLRFADDAAIMTDSQKKLQELMDHLVKKNWKRKD